MVAQLRRLLDTADQMRRALVVAIHLGLIVLANYAAFLLRFEGAAPEPQGSLFVEMLPWLLLVRGAVFLPFRLYEGLWRYTSIWDLRNIVGGVASSTVLFYVLVHYGFSEIAYSRSIFVIDAVLLVCLMSGVRLSRRIYGEIHRGGRRRRALIYGAGDIGEMLVRDMRKRVDSDYEPVGFIDDDPAKAGQRIHGVPVLGNASALAAIIERTRPQEILIAIPSADPATLRRIVRVMERFKLKITTVPSVREILDGRVQVSQVRELAPADLLARAPIGLDRGPVERLIRGRAVMVTGAGGSIGSELCRQVVTLGPARLVLFERYENNLYAIANELEDSGFKDLVDPVVGDVTDPGRLTEILSKYRPDIIFHAAAHKHVPLMEQNPCEAVKNNVKGTRLLVEAAERHGVDRFVLISTDKAVNPSSVMGATKRIAELMVQARAVGSGTSFFGVRFGNVLASNGSVVPRFLDQIRAGGPVTVTHPDMRRFFMLIPEAVQLVLHSAAHGENGQIYVLEMGEPVRLVDMARHLIRLSGHVPDEEIPIAFVGLRAGEKLEEELVGPHEVAEHTSVEKVLKVRPKEIPDAGAVFEEVTRLEEIACAGRSIDVLAQLAAIIPEFRPMKEQAGSVTPAATIAHLQSSALPSVRAPITSAVQLRCKECGSSKVLRSRPRTLSETIWLSLSQIASTTSTQGKKLYRCHSCGWRGWMVRTESAQSLNSFADTAVPDLTALDTVLGVAPTEQRSTFIPRDLET